MASHPPQQCCTVGVKHEGEATGEYGKIGSYDAYFAHTKDKSTANGVLIIPDVIGHKFINAQLIADQFAANGYFTVLIDPFRGDSIPLNRPEGFSLDAWRVNHGTEAIDPIIETAISEMKSKYGVKKLGAVGYCFGGKYVVRFLKKGLLDAGYTAHPSFVDVEELQKIEGPFAISAAETDQIFTPEKRHTSETILKGLGVPYQIFLFSGVQHGFAVRTDISQPIAKLAKEQAFLQAINWFDEFVKKS